MEERAAFLRAARVLQRLRRRLLSHRSANPLLVFCLLEVKFSSSEAKKPGFPKPILVKPLAPVASSCGPRVNQMQDVSGGACVTHCAAERKKEKMFNLSSVPLRNLFIPSASHRREEPAFIYSWGGDVRSTGSFFLAAHQ